MSPSGFGTSDLFGDDAAQVSRRTLLRGGMGLVAIVGLVTTGCQGGTPNPSATSTPTQLGAPAQSTPSAPPAAPDTTMTVTLLGTGSPNPNPNRFSAATLVQAGSLNMLIDAGRGCAIRLGQLKIPLGTISPLFLTHFHSDHMVGMTDVWMTGYIQSTYGKRSTPMSVIGPPGTKQIVEGMHNAFLADARIRIADEKTPELATGVDAREFSNDGTVFEADGVKVTAFAVNHGELIKPSYGYRVDYSGRSMLISGDTKFDENVIRNGTGVDLLLHEVCDAPAAVLDKLQNRAVADHHTTAEEAGTVFSRAAPKLGAYTHLIQLTDTGSTPNINTAQIEEATRRTYPGPLVVGDDLTRFVIGDTVEVQRWDPARQAYPQ